VIKLVMFRLAVARFAAVGGGGDAFTLFLRDLKEFLFILRLSLGVEWSLSAPFDRIYLRG